MSSSDNIITIILLAAVAYVLYSVGLTTKSKETSSAVSQECPRGQLYSRGLFGDCDPNYKMDVWTDFWNGGNCVCMSKINKAAQQNISGTAQAAAQDRQATTNPDVPKIASPVTPDNSPMSPSTPDFFTQTGMAISGAFSGLENWIAGGLGL